ncbi:ribosome silencing factor [bacterium]|nr:ribosome silencing factor [bacterium]
MDTKSLLDKITQTALDIKALDLVVFDMDGKSAITDYLVICHGTSTAHTQGIADNIGLALKKEGGILPLGIEGREEGRWILIDYNAVIVHIFLEDVREQYSLEEIFSTFPKKEC